MDDIGLSVLKEEPRIEWEFLKEAAAELRSDQVASYDALVVLAPKVTASTVRGNRRLLLVARFGVGYDSVDVDACTAAGVALTITPDGVRRPVATSAILYLLALGHRLLAKDRITRTGRWAEKLDHTGVGLTGRTLGLVGLGNIGQEVFRLARPFEMRHIACDPYARPEAASSVGAQLVDLPTLLRTSDFVCICCSLTPETFHLINRERLALMKPTAFLINVARGPIVDQAALTQALAEHRIQGAALDVFEKEPPDPDDPILKLDNVILSPHAICWTDECFLGIGKDAFRSVVEVARGRVPDHVVNRSVLESPEFQAKLRRQGGPAR
ncbi:MAG: dehydrogenase [Chloroflexi bacterium]|nr:dehydrogenase [Chloroflexota bacterium]